MGASEKCDVCRAMDRQDALTIATLEVVETIHNACAPVTYFTCRCRTCGAWWNAIEVYDEEGTRPSEWSWAEGSPPSATTG